MAEALAAVERVEKERQEQEENTIDVEVIDSHPQDETEAADTQSEAQSSDSQANDDTGQDEEAVLREQLLRLAADFENFRKRASRQMQEARQYGAERLLSDLLLIVDNLERALAHSEGDNNPIVDGVRMVAKQFLDVLGTHGVTRFDSLGKPFDPERHEAVGQAPAGDRVPGTVLEEIIKGYFIHDRLLRPAQVLVAATPREQKQTEEGE